MQDPAKVRGIFAAIAGRYDLANHLLSGGIDFLWRRRCAALVASWAPRDLLDLATGSGDLALEIRRTSPRTRILGADFCLPMLLEADRKGLPELLVADATKLPLADRSFDAVTVAFGLRNMASWAGALAEMARVLRPGGHLLILDFSLPEGLLGLLYRGYLHGVLPRLAGALTGHQSGYEYLGESIESFPSGDAMLRLVEGSGFAEATAEPLTRGIVSIYTARKAS